MNLFFASDRFSRNEMELPAFSLIESYAEGDPELFYMTEQHRECADWKLKVVEETTVVTLPVHSQYLAAASSVFRGLISEKVDCSSPIELGKFDVQAALAAMRYVYRPDAVNASTIQILMQEGLIVDVLRIGDKFDFFFYDSLLKMFTPKFLSTVPHFTVVTAAVDAFLFDFTELRPVLESAVTEIMAELQQSGNAQEIDDLVEVISTSPALLQSALAQSLKSLSLSNPHAIYGFCGKKKDSWEQIDAPPALFTYSFTRCKRRDGTLPISFYSPTFTFEDYHFRVVVYLDKTVEERRGKFVGVFLFRRSRKTVGEEAEAVTVKAQLRVVNLRNNDSSWSISLNPNAYLNEQNGWGCNTLAPMSDALLPTASGPMCCVQVVSMEVVDRSDDEN